MKDTSILGHPSLVPRSGGCPCPAAQLCRAGGQQATLASASGQGRECGSRGSAWLSSGVHPACTPAAPAQNPNRAPTSPPIPGEDRIVSGSELGCHTAGDDEHNQGLNCRDQGRKNRTQPNPVRSTPPAPGTTTPTRPPGSLEEGPALQGCLPGRTPRPLHRTAPHSLEQLQCDGAAGLCFHALPPELELRIDGAMKQEVLVEALRVERTDRGVVADLLGYESEP